MAAINDVTGSLVSCLLAEDDDQIVLMTDGGQAVRARVRDVSVIGRATRGVRLLALSEGQHIASVALVASASVEAEAEVLAAVREVEAADAEALVRRTREKTAASDGEDGDGDDTDPDVDGEDAGLEDGDVDDGE